MSSFFVIPFLRWGEGGHQTAVLVGGRSGIPGHETAGTAGIPQTLDLGGQLVGTIGVVGLTDGIVCLDPGAD